MENLVSPPKVLEVDGQKVVSFIVSEEDRKLPGYVEAITDKAKKLKPTVKSNNRQYWASLYWQKKRRMRDDG